MNTYLPVFRYLATPAEVRNEAVALEDFLFALGRFGDAQFKAEGWVLEDFALRVSGAFAS